MNRPAIFTLGLLLTLVVIFLWAITPRQPKEVLPSTAQIATSQSGYNAIKTLNLNPAQKARIAKYAEGWSKVPAYEVDFNALDPSYKVASISTSLFDPADEYWGLPRDDKGSFELVDAYCTACHSLSIVMQQRATAERWAELLIWMEQKQGMAALPLEDEALVLEYIGTYFSTQ